MATKEEITEVKEEEKEERRVGISPRGVPWDNSSQCGRECGRGGDVVKILVDNHMPHTGLCCPYSR
jgi:hypothetical protein